MSIVHYDGLFQDCSNSSVLAMEILQSCTKPTNILVRNSFPVFILIAMPVTFVIIVICIIVFIGTPFTNTSIQAWISNHIYYKVWDNISYQFPNFNGVTDLPTITHFAFNHYPF